MISITVLFIVYILFVFRVGYRAMAQVEQGFVQHMDLLKQKHHKVLSKKEHIHSEKQELAQNAKEIFTLYELTKEITKTNNEEEAFRIFQHFFRRNVMFKTCHLIKPNDPQVEGLKKRTDVFVFHLHSKNTNLGYLIVERLLMEDFEKVKILGHQFALALRRVQLYKELEYSAIRDGLTDLHTRRYTLERLNEETIRAMAKKIPLSFLMVDVDFFKSFNDRYGHLTGDQILREIAEIIKESIREIDIAGRYGGEEFCVVLPDTNQEGALLAAERIRQATEKKEIVAYDTRVYVTVSVGVATFPTDAENAEELLDKADLALYRSKQGGRNRVTIFESES
ncbi:MAG: GGDEF domain-containing protein [Candidatus Omnitrophica bacterium]|nr:GGDEF domain-containing protein [Candidatus Omnitrophota bacterium]